MLGTNSKYYWLVVGCVGVLPNTRQQNFRQVQTETKLQMMPPCAFKMENNVHIE